MRHFLVIFKQCAIWPNVFLSAGKNALTESFYLQKQYESLTTEGKKAAFSRQQQSRWPFMQKCTIKGEKNL